MDFHLPSLPKIKAQQGQTSTVTIAQSCVPYGTVRDTSHLTPETLTTYGFAGEMADVTGLTYLRARYYSPLEGRFMSRD
ncbi:MAG TPA: RHS repeat-associated core domain-containing protein, partial [Anaerolineales bacterium]|nr:RHS repeat-associated core domain-containing protein [Anaerolineales bacterium]